MSNYYDILANISSLNDSLLTDKKTKTKKNVHVWEKILYELFLKESNKNFNFLNYLFQI